MGEGVEGARCPSPGLGLGMIGKAALEGSLDRGAERYLCGVGDELPCGSLSGIWEPGLCAPHAPHEGLRGSPGRINVG